MQRVRKFLVYRTTKNFAGNRLAKSALTQTTQCEGWHNSWGTAVRLMGQSDGNEFFEVAIAEDTLDVIAIFSSRNLETKEKGPKDKTKWKSSRVSAGADGCWCNLNYSDYGWGWVSGADREVPFRLQYLERQAESNPDGLISRTRAWASEIRDWVFGHGKKIG